MIVSWDWLKEYVSLDMPLEDLTHRLTMSGLNLEGVEPVGNDTAIDLEVTSNRPDCLGHIGVAREIAVLYGKELKIPSAAIAEIPQPTADVTSVEIECAELCPRYFARVIQGVKVGPSPDWLVSRLASLGIASINNVVDITNYVLMECGQPLHAFDFDKLAGGRILVRQARPGEKIVAIDQREYPLSQEMCIIADAENPVAIGGVMGGLETEISDRTANVLIETAEFRPLSIRNTARKLNLHSDSSYRFERGVDAAQLDWASRRCCELIQQIAGGELLKEPVIAGDRKLREAEPITLRFAQVPRILGIDVPADESKEILSNLGLQVQNTASDDSADFVPPSWRLRDLKREIDLIEEVARIYGYEKIPDNVEVPLQLSRRTHSDRVASRVREVLPASGFYEAITLSFVNRETFELFHPEKDMEPLTVDHSSRRNENMLRQSLIPSLMQSRRENERHGTFDAELFELGRVYLSAEPGSQAAEPAMLGIVGGRSFADLKGVVETLAHSVNSEAEVTVSPVAVSEFVEGRGAEVFLNGQSWGLIGEIDRAVSDRIDLRDAVVAAELRVSVLEEQANLLPQYRDIAKYPAIARDLNFVFGETVTWHQVDEVVRESAGPLLDDIRFAGQYRGKQIPAGKKSYVVTLQYRSPDRTLTNEEVDGVQSAVIAACEKKLDATLR